MAISIRRPLANGKTQAVRPQHQAQLRLGRFRRLDSAQHAGASTAQADLLKFGKNAANDLDNERCQDAGQKNPPWPLFRRLPEFFIKLLTDEGAFAGSNTTGAVAERVERWWVAVERGG